MFMASVTNTQRSKGLCEQPDGVCILGPTMTAHTGKSGFPRYVVIGGGVTGCVLAERLKQRRPQSSVTLVEGSSTLGGLSVRSEPDPIGWDRFYHVVTPQDVMLTDWHCDGSAATASCRLARCPYRLLRRR